MKLVAMPEVFFPQLKKNLWSGFFKHDMARRFNHRRK